MSNCQTCKKPLENRAFRQFSRGFQKKPGKAGYGSRTRLTALGRLGTADIPIPHTRHISGCRVRRKRISSPTVSVLLDFGAWCCVAPFQPERPPQPADQVGLVSLVFPHLLAVPKRRIEAPPLVDFLAP